MNSTFATLLFRASAVAAFALTVAPALAFLGFAVAVSVAARALVFPRLSELPGLYMEAAPSVCIAGLLLAVALELVSRKQRQHASRARVVSLSTLAFACVYAVPIVEDIALRGRVSNVHLLIGFLGIVAGIAVGATLPKTLLRIPGRNGA